MFARDSAQMRSTPYRRTRAWANCALRGICLVSDGERDCQHDRDPPPYGRASKRVSTCADDARAEALHALARDLVQTRRDMLEKPAAASPEHFTRMRALIAGLGRVPKRSRHLRARVGPIGNDRAVRRALVDDRERPGLSSVSTDRGRLDKRVMPLLGRKLIATWARTTCAPSSKRSTKPYGTMRCTGTRRTRLAPRDQARPATRRP